MSAAAHSPRARFQSYRLDGALLFFQPSSGANIRVQNERTRSFTRGAPRAVMFGITNRCNLHCTFCSRDVTRPSDWTVESAAEMLQGLARAGSLEVAFGGGEPFAFRGFAELIAELHRSTRLALNVTSNGTLLDARSFGPFRGLLGQVRLSIYDDARWRTGARVLSEAGQLWGANVLVDERRLSELRGLLETLAALGCHDVSLLNYVGGDPALQLSARGRQQLAEVIACAPLSCRVSVCFGGALDVPRLFEGADGAGDCGAGVDFVTITPDRQLQSCSFHDHGVPVRRAEDVLEVWRSKRTELGRASTRTGCARRLPLAAARETPPRSLPALAAWQAFSGNNSGECVLVGKFASHREAEDYVAELKAAWDPDADDDAAWQALVAREQVSVSHQTRDDGSEDPPSLAHIGRSAIAVSYAAGDAFPELRALTWKRAGYVVPGGIHLHASPSLLAAIRCRDSDDLRAVASRSTGQALFPHGDVLLVRVPEATKGDEGIEGNVAALVALAEGRPLGGELVLDDWDDAAFLRAKQRLGVELQGRPRLLVAFGGHDGGDRARRFAATIREATVHRAGSRVLIEGVSRPKRLATLATRQGGHASPLEGLEVKVTAWLPVPAPPPTKGKRAPRPSLNVDAVRAALSSRVREPIVAEPGSTWTPGVQVSVTTSDPATVLVALARVATELGVEAHLWAVDVAPLDFLLRRLLADVART